MAGIFRDGFDSYNGTGGGPVGIGSKWTNNGGISLVSGRFGGKGLELGNSAGNGVSGPLDSAVANLTFHCGLYIVNGMTVATSRMVRFYSGATEMCALSVTPSGEIVAYRSATELGRSAVGVLAFDAWVSLAWELVIHATTGRFTVYIDGNQVLNLTNVNTRNGTPTTVDKITPTLSANLGGSAKVRIDDIYVIDSATRLTNHPRIVSQPVTGDGATLNYTPSTGTSHYAVVDEIPASAADYLSASTVGDVDELTLAALSSTPLSIEEVCVVGYLQKTDATTRSMALGVKSGGTTSDGPNYALNSTGLRHERPIATDPNTAAAWSASGVNSLTLRPKVTV